MAIEKWLETATPEEKRQSFIDAGIITEDGQLAPHYRTPVPRKRKRVRRAAKRTRKQPTRRSRKR